VPSGLTGGSLEERELARDLDDAFSIPLRDLRESDSDDDLVESVDVD
jgi:hypothetical protein